MILRFFAPMRPRLAAAAILGALAYITGIGLIAVSGWLISRASQMPPVLTLSVAIVLVRAFGVGRAVFRYCERLVSHDAVLRSLVELRVRLYQSLVEMPVWQVLRMRRAEMLTALVRDVDDVQYLPLRALVPAVGSSIAAVACIVVEFSVDVSAGLWVAAGWLIAATTLPWLAWGTSRRVAESTAADASEMAAVCMDLIEGSADIAALGLSGRAMAQASYVDARMTDTATRFASRTAAVNGLLMLVQGLMVVGAAWSAVRAISFGNVDPVMLATVVFIPLAMTEVLAAYSAAALTAAAAQPSVQRLARVLAGGELATAEVGVDARAVERIEVAAGARIGVAGPSGSGKSTILAVLAGLLPQPGDGAGSSEISPLGLPGSRGRLVTALAEQEPQVFATSIAENLQLAKPVDAAPLTDVQMWQALSAVGLDDWVRGLPAGLDSMVGIGGAKLSGGQKQRLSLARMFIADPDVWLLDEPTVHLDHQTAVKVLDSVRAATQMRTLVVAAHDSRDLALCDHVIRVDAVERAERA